MSMVQNASVSQTNSQQPKKRVLKHLSPFRYPGGKSWFVGTVRRWLRSQPNPHLTLIEPFGGGAGISLTAASEGLVAKSVFAELDDQVATILQNNLSESEITMPCGPKSSASMRLAERVLDFCGTHSKKKGVSRSYLRNRTTPIALSIFRRKNIRKSEVAGIAGRTEVA
jgi:hypothetical protein